MHIISIAGTYQPAHCGVAHYLQQLRTHLSQRDISSQVLTSHTAATGDPQVIGVVQDWGLSALLPLVRRLGNLADGLPAGQRYQPENETSANRRRGKFGAGQSPSNRLLAAAAPVSG